MFYTLAIRTAFCLLGDMLETWNRKCETVRCTVSTGGLFFEYGFQHFLRNLAGRGGGG